MGSTKCFVPSEGGGYKKLAREERGTVNDYFPNLVQFRPGLSSDNECQVPYLLRNEKLVTDPVTFIQKLCSALE